MARSVSIALIAVVAVIAVGLGERWTLGASSLKALPLQLSETLPLSVDVIPEVRAQSATGTAIIVGTITSARTSQPIRGARVTLTGSPVIGTARAGGAAGASVNRAVVSDLEGRFSFERLPAGRFAVSANRDQFLQVSYGAKVPGSPGRLIELADGQRADISMQMMRGGALSGTIIDETGDPIVHARVRALRYGVQNGSKRLRVVQEDQTDDRGMYRIFGLEPGEYLISATPDPADLLPLVTMLDDDIGTVSEFSGRVVSGVTGNGFSSLTFLANAAGATPVLPDMYVPTFHPVGATASNALAVRLGPGEERSSIDIRALPTRTGTIQGTVIGSTTASVGVQVLLQNRDPLAETTALVVPLGPDGLFTMSQVPPGDYTVYAQTISAAGPQPSIAGGMAAAGTQGVRLTPADPALRLNGRAPVTVESQRTALVSITLQPGRSIAGRVVFDMMRPPDRTRMTTVISIVPAPQTLALPAFNTSPQVPLKPDGTFTLAGIRPGRYFLRASGPGTLESALLNGEDTLDFPIEITGDRDVDNVTLTLTDRTTQVSGALMDAAGKPGVDYTVVLAAVDSRYWTLGSRRVVTARPGGDGTYSIRGVPAGQYVLGIVTGLELDGQYDPVFLQGLASGVRVTVGAGAAVTQNVRLPQ